MKKMTVTTSWDDGHALDMKLATLLHRYDLAGTFYIAPENRELAPNDRLRKEQLLELARDFEIGAHTVTHRRLPKIHDAEARQEISLSKKLLEDILGRKVKSFCYPGGDHQEKHKRMVREAGFSLARTTDRFKTEPGNDGFALPTTVHTYRHLSDAAQIFREAGVANFVNEYLHWDKLAIALFNKVVASGGIFHLWGHSWEIEKYNDWKRLERVFAYIAHRPGVRYVPNGELI